MGRDNDFGAISRRRFVQYLAMLAVGGRTLLDSRDARAALYAAREAGGATAEWPDMTYRTLGRTEWNASRLVFGCGAALMFRPKRISFWIHAIRAIQPPVLNGVKNMSPWIRTLRKPFLYSERAVRRII